MSKGRRGEVWLADLGMIAKTRPCLIISIPYQDDERSLITIVPHTTSTRGTRFEVDLRSRFLKRNGAFDAQNLVTIPNAKLIRRLGTLQSSDFDRATSAVKTWLDL